MKEQFSDFIVAGLGFGDEGKGTITDYLTYRFGIKYIIRFNGGSQAAHNVVTPEGISHTFSQFGSGTFTKGTRTFLASQMLIDPYSLLEEESVLKQKGILDAMNRLTLDANCPIITPFHKMLGRMREVIRGKERFGSTGKGVGQAVFDLDHNKKKALFLKDFFNHKILSEKLELHYLEKFRKALEFLSRTNSLEASKIFLYFKNKYPPNKLLHFYRGFASSYSKCIDKSGKHFQNLLKSKSSLLFEGAQGTLLDPEFGFFPYITKTNTKFAYAESLLSNNRSNRKPFRIGVLRAYSHRHGAGPLPTESKVLSKKIQEEHNLYNPWQGNFRTGWLDLILCRYGIRINNSIHSIALTCLDQLSGFSKIKVCTSYEYKGIFPKNQSRFFQYENLKSSIKITGINHVLHSTTEERIRLTEILLNCKPLEYLEFKGWKENLTLIRDPKDLPRNLKIYLDYLESREGLGFPISILSFGKTREEKMIYRKIF